MNLETDILAFGAHPDDVELGCGGTIAKHTALGDSVTIIDLTQGELGTRGTPEVRANESKKAQKILSVKNRFNLKFADGWIENNRESQLSIISYIRQLRPKIVLCTAPNDRHPDHIAASRLVIDSCFKSGLEKISTTWNEKKQRPFRPQNIYHYIQFYEITPDFNIDISDYFLTKMKAIEAHSSQFYDPNSKEPETVISSKEFYDSISARSSEWGRAIGVDYAEGFVAERRLGVSRITDLC